MSREAFLDRVRKAALAGRRAQPWYRQIVGDFAGDPAFAEILRLGRQIRRGQRKG